MSKENLSTWMPGIVVHTHTRLDELLPAKERSREAAQHDGLTSIRAAVWYAKKLFGQEDVLLCDTDHTFHALDRQGISRKGCFSPERLRETIAVVDRETLRRARLIRQTELSPNILTGVEANILNANGQVDVSDSVLAELDIVIASLHYRCWKGANGDKKPSKEDYLRSLEMAARNPHIDIIGHPTADLQPNHQESMRLEDWDRLFQVMQQTQVAYEINLSGYHAASPNRRLERQLIARAAEAGVLFAVGLDFHGFAEYHPLAEDRFFDLESISQASEQHRGKSNFRLFRRIGRIRLELESLGVTRENLLTSSRRFFQDWLEKRHGK